MRDFYCRRLPHYQPPDGIFSTTLRLVDSLPQTVVQSLFDEQRLKERWLQGLPDGRKKQACFSRSREEYAQRFDNAIHTYHGGPHWLARVDIAQLVKDSLVYAGAKWCSLLAYCIMSNHVHAMIGIGDWPVSIGAEGEGLELDKKHIPKEFPLTNALGSIKKYTARRANRILGRSGAFWQEETFDHLIRNGEELERAAWYTLMNPVKAGLCHGWEDWPWTYCSPWLRERL
jgi:putative transposase